MPSIKKWCKYEDVVKQLIYDVRDFLEIGRVEGKQKIKGTLSSTEWEVDVVAYNARDEKLILVECKYRSHSKLSQEVLGGFAYRVMDAEADRGIIVTTIGLQEGASKVASASKIIELKLDPNSTSADYIAKIANQIFIKSTESIKINDHINIEVRDANGDLKDKREQ